MLVLPVPEDYIKCVQLIWKHLAYLSCFHTGLKSDLSVSVSVMQVSNFHLICRIDRCGKTVLSISDVSPSSTDSFSLPLRGGSNTFVNLHLVIVYIESAADAVVYQGKNLFPLNSHLSIAVLRSFKNIHLYAWCRLMDTSTSGRIVKYSDFISTVTQEVYYGLQRYYDISTRLKNTNCPKHTQTEIVFLCYCNACTNLASLLCSQVFKTKISHR